MNKTQHLTEISKKDGKYFFRYELIEKKEIQFALPVFTNANSMTDKLGTSKVYKKLVCVEKTSDIAELEEVDSETVQLIYNMAKANDMIQSFERFESVNGWVVRIK
jgi:hypothetical protein